MPFQRITFSPGVNQQRTPTANKGGWSFCNLIRFREGLPEVKGGWVAFVAAALQGAIRGLHAWATLSGIATLGAGTTERLYVVQGGTAYDVTPAVATNTLTNPFVTTAGSSVITVNDGTAPGGLAPGNFVEISGGTAVAGLTLAGEYIVQSVISPTEYTLTVAPLTANAAATGGGSVTIAYLLAVGSVNTLVGTGWGTGTWGAGTWGTPRTGGTVSAGVAPARVWTIDNWGENMIACARGAGSIYQWVAGSGVTVRAAALTNAPAIANGAIVAAPIEMVVAFGCNPPLGGAQDPMLVAWSDEGNNTVWTPLVTNQAGSFRLNNGSQIMQAIPIQLQILIWTDTALFGMQYIQPPLVWSFNQLGASCGAISPNAACVLGGVALWMSSAEFWMYNGTATIIDCAVRDTVFKGMNQAQQSKICCVTNSEWSEVSWNFPSTNSSENDSYVTINLDEMSRSGPLNCWYGGGVAFAGAPFVRTAGIDTNVFGSPIGGDASGNVWSEEQGYTAGGAAMPWFIQSGFVDIADGEDYSFLDLLIPDQILAGGACAYTILSIVDPADAQQIIAIQQPGVPEVNVGGAVCLQYGPFTVGPNTRFLPNGVQGLRARARAVALRIDNSLMVVGNFWRMGAPRARITRDGRN